MSDLLNAYKATLSWAAAAHIETIARETSPSTNTEAKALLEQLGHRSLVIANHQTAGRGRGNHNWSDSKGQALLSSWVFRVNKSPQPIMSALIGLALFESVSKTWPEIAWALKAPNDLHVIEANGDAKKIAGILIELTNSAIAQVSIIVGVGMNVSGAPEGTQPYAATSLQAALSLQGKSPNNVDWSTFLSAWVANCEMRIDQGLESGLRADAREALALALRRHPEFRELNTVDADGSLKFNDGSKVKWTSL